MSAFDLRVKVYRQFLFVSQRAQQQMEADSNMWMLDAAAAIARGTPPPDHPDSRRLAAGEGEPLMLSAEEETRFRHEAEMLDGWGEGRRPRRPEAGTRRPARYEQPDGSTTTLRSCPNPARPVTSCHTTTHSQRRKKAKVNAAPSTTEVPHGRCSSRSCRSGARRSRGVSR